jgi:hypothetical protein
MKVPREKEYANELFLLFELCLEACSVVFYFLLEVGLLLFSHLLSGLLLELFLNSLCLVDLCHDLCCICSEDLSCAVAEL